jgi:hypothetical protein
MIFRRHELQRSEDMDDVEVDMVSAVWIKVEVMYASNSVTLVNGIARVSTLTHVSLRSHEDRHASN